MLTAVSGRSHPLELGEVPRWARSWGQDSFGIWASVGVGAVEYRFRWIPGGAFVLGSPESEAGRYADESQRPCRVGSFWLGETPCTQALWREVMGMKVTHRNPSRFVGLERPVESVSFDDCAQMLRALNEQVEFLSARFPSEEEWEFACRAGTTAATYAGDLDLGAIAWYGANSGGSTHPVGQKRPNGFGLFDMLGNVWEWCDDAVVARSGRVYRGGSWLSAAQFVRAASRFANHPFDRNHSLGFRLARGRVEPTESGTDRDAH